MTEQAFEAMVRQYEKLVYTVCCQLVHDHQLAEDLSQETFVSAYLHMESCPPGAEKPWLCRIAVNKAKDHLKSAYNRRMAGTEAPGDTAPALAAAQNVPSLEAECETRADAGLARECIEGLAEPYRTVSVLYFMQEWPVEAIARQLGRMPQTVHTQLSRAKKMLRRELAAGGGAQTGAGGTLSQCGVCGMTSK